MVRKHRWQHFCAPSLQSEFCTIPTLKSTAISDAGLTSQTIYEVERTQFTRSNSITTERWT